MPNIDPGAREWELDLAGRIGKAVASRRKALGLTAVEVADRTKELGYPITRVAVAKIENNGRAGKIDVAEILVLAAALDLPPVLLLLPSYPDGEAELLPGRPAKDGDSLAWITGTGTLPVREGEESLPPNPGVDLIREAVVEWELRFRELEIASAALATEGDETLQTFREGFLERHREKIAVTARAIKAARTRLWGKP
jgi:transcriptional regulator with XRE-family HTH domain